MAVVNQKGTLVVGPLDQQPPSLPATSRNAGRKRSSIDRFTVASGDSQTSTYVLARVPKDAVINGEECTLHFAALGAATTLDVGAGTNADAFVKAASSASAGKTVFDGIGLPDLHRFLWELAGYSKREDAPMLIDIFVTLGGADAGSSGDIVLQMTWTDD